VLYVGGTGGNDTISINKVVSGTTVSVNGGTPILYGGGTVVVYAGDGHDDVNVASAATANVEIYAGAGNDTINGGGGNDVLVGSSGNDLLYGGAGRDLLIGGTDADGVFGEVSDDILIASVTVHDADPTALHSIMSIWTSGATFSSRVSQLRGGLLTAGEEVIDDTAVDTLTGKNGSDWFFYSSTQDQVTDLKSADEFDDLGIVALF
jgi:Ca2+-binding RTX toxin-like protein